MNKRNGSAPEQRAEGASDLPEPKRESPWWRVGTATITGAAGGLAKWLLEHFFPAHH